MSKQSVTKLEIVMQKGDLFSPFHNKKKGSTQRLILIHMYACLFQNNKEKHIGNLVHYQIYCGVFGL